jgi:hypothetical protein
MFWLLMNKGQWWSSPKKIFLTIINFLILGIACAIVSFSTFCNPLLGEWHADCSSVGWDFMSLASLFTTAPQTPAGRVLAMLYSVYVYLYIYLDVT